MALLELTFRKLRALALAVAALLGAANASLVATCQEVAKEPNADAIEESAANPATLKAIDLYLAGDVDGAYELLKSVYDANPDSDPPGVLLALLHSHANRFLEMRRALEKTAEDYPADPEAYFQLATVDIREGRFLEAELLIERGEKLSEGYAEIRPESKSRLQYFKEEALNARALLAEKRGRYDAATELVKKLIALNPSDAQARWNLGYLAMKLNNYEAAEAAFDEAAKLKPDLWSGWLQVVSALDRDDRLDEAKAQLERAQDKIATASPSERAQLARIYLRLSMIEEAGAIAKRFEEENDASNVDRWILDGWLALYANNYAAAEEFFRNATIVEPDNFEASNGLALALLDQGNREKLNQARQIATRNYRAHSDSLDATTTYAWTLFLSGAAKEAENLFQPILTSGELNATTAYYLAEIAHVRGDLELADNLLTLALSQKANFPKRAAARELKAIVEEKRQPPKDLVQEDFDQELVFGEEEEEEEEEDAQVAEPNLNDQDAGESDKKPEDSHDAGNDAPSTRTDPAP